MRVIFIVVALICVGVHGDMVTTWNNHLITALRFNGTQSGPTWGSRAGAIMHLAMHDALNSIIHRYERYMVTRDAPSSASQNAAMAAAAHHVLVSLFPDQETTLNQYLTDALTGIHGQSRDDGLSIGRHAGRTLIAMREDDGNQDSNPIFTPSPLPLHWQPDPTVSPTQKALGAYYGNVDMFAGDRVPGNYPIPAPPNSNSSAWADAYNEVKSVGQDNSTTRTVDQTQIANFWAYDRPEIGPVCNLYNQWAQKIASIRHNSLSDNARFFALLNMAMADAGIACWHYKYKFDLARPITAIRDYFADTNPDTVTEFDWTPLGAPNGLRPRYTPPFPSYASGHATFGGSVSKMMQLFYGTDHVTFSLTSDELPGVTRTFHSFSAASFENYMSRVYLGVHYRFDGTAGESQGQRVADYIFHNYLRHN